jgi:hypothetical protein
MQGFSPELRMSGTPNHQHLAGESRKEKKSTTQSPTEESSRLSRLKHPASTHDGIPQSLLPRAAETATAQLPMLLSEFSRLGHQRFGRANGALVPGFGAPDLPEPRTTALCFGFLRKCLQTAEAPLPVLIRVL